MGQYYGSETVDNILCGNGAGMYQFFVDEQYMYLLDNTRRNYNDGIIYRVDETGEPVMLECRIERKDNKNRIRSRIITDY